MNKRTEQTRWTPKRLLSLLMALIMTLSLLPTAAFAADGEASTLGTSAENPVEITFSSDRYATADTSLIKKTITEEDDTSYTVTFKPQIQFVDNSGKGTASTFIYQSGIPFKPGVSISTNANEEKTIGRYTYTVQQVNADGTDAPNTTTVTNNILGTSTIRAASSLSCEGSDFTAKALENNMIRLKYTVYEGESASGSPFGEVYVGITGITVTDIKYNVSYKTDGPDDNIVPVSPEGNNSYASYTVSDAIQTAKAGYTFTGWKVHGPCKQNGAKVNAGEQLTNITGDITLTADYEQNYTITFQSEYSGASGLMTPATSNGTKYTVPVEPTMYGFTFAGWKVTKTGGTLTATVAKGTDGKWVVDGIDSDITLTAQWTKDGTTPAGSHTVTFLAGAADAYIPFVATATVADGATYQIPTAVPTRKGYTFDGWANGTTTYSAGKQITNVTTDIVLSAKWTATPVTIDITNANGSDVAVTGLHPNSSIGDKVHFTVKVPVKYNTADLRVTAGNYISSYIVLAPVDRVEVKNTTTGAVESVVLYYQFTVEEDLTYEDPPHGLKLLVHVDTVPVKTFNVTLPTGAGFDAAFTDTSIVDKFTTVNYNGTVSFTVTPRTGYTVKGVYANGAMLTPDAGTYKIENIKSNQAVTVDMAAIQFHTVTYVLDGKQMATQSVQDNATLTPPSAPNKTGYNWDGKWYTKENYSDPFTGAVTENLILYGRYTPKDVTISYDLNGGSWPTGVTAPASVTKTYGLAATLTETIPVKDGHTFLGWSETNGATAASYLPGATFSKEIEVDTPLFAVWQKNTYTITFSSGEGYSLHSIGSMTVAHGENFEFNLFVDPAYAQNTPTVYVNTGSINATNPKLISTSDAPTDDGAKVYLYRLENVTANTAINAEVTTNATYTVTFMTGTDVYQTQQVEFNHKATQPVDPKVEGYTFGGWYKNTGWTAADKWDFSTPITDNTTLHAKLDPIEPKITWPTATTGYTIAVKYTKPGDTTATELTTNPGTVPYKSVVTFTINILDGYDASKMQVGINGVLFAPKDKSEDGKTYTFEFIAKQDTEAISVTGVERKTVTITYYDNARDDTSNSLAPQIANYYVENATDNSTFTKQAPVRTGYTFLGWSTDGTATEATYKWTDIKSDSGLTIKFTKDTALYAIWKADALTAELIITDEFTSAPSGTTISGSKLEYAYEGDSITLVGKLSADAQGTMTFYKKAKTATDWTFLGTTSINGGNYGVLGTTVENYKWGNADDAATKSNYRWDYKVEFKPTTDEGYSPCDASDDLRVYSKAISWEVDKKTDKTNFDWIKAQNELTIYTDEARTATTDKMTANSTYWLQIPAVYELDGGLNLKNNNITKLSVGTHYEITWEYEDSANHWTTYATTSDTDWVKVTPEYSGYSFRAKVTPTQSSIYTKAATYDENGTVVKDVYWDYLITKATAKTEKQATATELAITGADDEAANVTINGASDVFTDAHLAQFEGQKVTLTATVTDTTANAGVKSGEVKFFRYVDGTKDELLNTTLISVDSNGVATCEVEISKWTGGNVTDNKDQFYAVYQPNATYDTSASWTAAAGELKTVYIKSTAIKTPIIDSTLANDAGETATTYTDNLTGLLAGVEHTFTLRVGNDKADWSVVALDGRTVAAENYDIEWQYKTTGNFAKADNDSTAAIYTTKTTKFGDQYRVVLNPKGDMKTGATSKVAEIGKKQDVTVTVKALDAIESTAATDVYQLNEITLTATVAAANDKPTMQPTGTVTFYYKDGENWVKLDSTTLADATDGSGSKIASIKTSKLPVTDTTNIKRDVEITAVYSGDATFNASATVTGTEKYTITAAAGCTTTNDTVTVYSSVVFNCNDENKKQPTDGDKGIHISVSDGAFKTNEKATLALSDIYTLDRELTDETLRNTIAKLNPTTDYTVQWQKLNGATAIGDAEGTDFAKSKNWTNIDGKTGTTLVLDKVEQNTAYRAVITVKNQPITKGSFDKLDQGLIGTADANDGRQVYYSNVLMPTDTNMTVSVALNTSKIGAENTEGITEGETVTANVYLSGVVGAVPNANVTVTVTNDDAKGNGTAGEYKQILGNKNTVNGWNAFDWDTTGVTPGFYTLTVSATTNTGYAAKEITRSLIVRESSYNIEVGNTNPTYNGHTQGLTVTLDGFDFKGTGINEAANKSWTVRYEDANGKLVEPSQAGKYTATITLPASAYWTEQTKTVDFTIEKRSVSIADAIAQAKVYDGTTDVNIVEVMLNDAVTDQTTNGTGLPTNNVGIINGDSIYAVATEAKLSSANAGDNSFTISTIALRGDDAANYVWDNDKYTENIYVSRSQVYGVSSTDVTLKAGEKLPADAVYMIDQAGNKITTYDVLYYLHTDTEIKKVDNTNEKGLYTVIARPKQDNYKSGVTLRVTVGDATGYTDAVAPKPSTLITISNTAELYGAAENKGIQTSFTNGATLTKLEYQAGTGWMTDRPTSAGRYLVKVTASTGDVAYGIYTITKAHPSIDVTPATGLTYNSMPQNGYTTLTGVEGKDASKDYYITYAGDVAIGYNTPADGNVDEQAPVDAGTYTVTLHVNETANYTAHEISKSFTIAKKALTIKADSWQTTQYDAFPDMTAGYTGLAAETGDTTPDTSLRDVQIAPEFLYNPTGGKSNYSNDSLDQVGGVAIQPIDALSKNYAITYENGQYTKQRTETNVDFAIHGLPQSSTGKNTVYYGDEIQLYPYGYYTTHANGSGIFNWSVNAGAPATIDADKGILKVTGVGEFIVTLTRGEGELQIETKLTVTALKKEVKVHVADQDKVYSGSAQTYSGEVKAYDELYATVNAATTTPANKTRTDIGTQITTSRIATGSEKYQSLVYGGKFTINDKDATVAPVADAHIYGTTRTIPSPAYTSTDSNAISNVLTASQTDAYNRLDVHDGYEILVAGTENMNYNVKYTTDHNDTAKNAEDSAVTTYQDVVFTSKTDKYLNDATIYGETPNVLDWTLVNVIGTTRDSVDYADNLADFDLPDTFVEQDKDDCTGNKVTYKAANRTTEISGSTVKYNQAALTGPRTSTDTATDENYTLKFNTVENSGAANYKLTNDKAGNSATTTNALTANSKGFIPAAGESNDVSGENFVEGSANIAQRPIKLEKAVTDAQLYWRLPQSQLYTALVNVLKAEENSVGRGLAKGHTIEDLDLSFTIGSTPVDKNNDQPMTGLTVGTQTVTVTVGDTNYKLEGSNTFEVDFQTMRIRATYYNKTFTGFDVRIEKIDAAGNWVGPLDSTKGLTFKVLKQTNGVLDTETDYAANKSFTFVSKDGTYGYFHGSYSQLPLLGNGELYVFQMYEYGVPLERK